MTIGHAPDDIAKIFTDYARAHMGWADVDEQSYRFRNAQYTYDELIELMKQHPDWDDIPDDYHVPAADSNAPAQLETEEEEENTATLQADIDPRRTL